MNESKDLRLAVLIDADNIPSRHIQGMLEEIAKYGNPTFKRIYGDWTRPNLAGWKKILLEHAITPIQQYAYTTGKNSSDSAMIIDAMDILYSGRVDGFCIVSSDSDFTRLATRLREAGMKVFGLGEKKTPSAFRSAVDKFIYIEILESGDSETETESGSASSKEKPIKKKQPSISKVDKELFRMISQSIDDIADDDGWAFLGLLGSLLIKKHPDFDPRNYGFPKLVTLIKNFDKFELDFRKSGQHDGKLVYVRRKS
jgi:Fe-S-cluster formation regulator IscX/YfhJ